jgi:hypothetical protein
MKNLHKLIAARLRCCAFLALLIATVSHAGLTVRMDEPKQVGKKAVILFV